MSLEHGYTPSPEETKLAAESMTELQDVMSEVRFRAVTDPELKGQKTVYIMRGVSGSGKSTIAREIAQDFDGKIHSTDEYFVDESGQYNFDRTKLGEAHKANFEAFKASLQHELPVVIVDNTNTKRWEFENYTKEAANAGYAVREVTAPTPELDDAVARNLHGVPESAIKNMLERFET